MLQFKTAYGQAVQDPQNRKCLQVAQNGGQTATPPDPVNVTATGKGFPSNTNIEIEFCQPSDKKTQCTTVTKTKSQLGKVNASFAIGGLEGHVPYSVYGTWPYKPVEMGGAAGDQQGTFTFLDQGNCVSITWDPYGRVFDSQSLEPIPNVKIGLLDSLNPDSYSQIKSNPQTVIEDGAFNFLSKPGTYYLKPIEFPKTYSFTGSPKLNKNYTKAYSKKDGTPSLYKPGEAIVEKAGVPEHRDIPLDPGTNPPSHFPIKNIPGQYNQMVFNTVTEYGGRISHPLSIIALVGKKSLKEVTRTTADKFGLWTIVINNLKIPQDEPLVIKLIKVDLTTGKYDEKTAVITKDVVFEPILRTMTGYVYDSNGVKLKNTSVSVILDGNQKTYYQTKSDKNGFIDIPTNYLPDFPYHISYKAPNNSVISLLLSSFVQQNKSYLEENSSNLMKTKNIKSSTTTPVTQPENNNDDNSVNNINQKTLPNSENQENNQPGNNVIFAIIICVLAAVVAGTVLYVNSKNKSSKRR